MTGANQDDHHPGRTVLCNKASGLPMAGHLLARQRTLDACCLTDPGPDDSRLPQSDETATLYKTLHYKANGISTTKYNLITFLPKA